MTKTAEITDIYSAIEESARQRDVACSRDRIWPVIAAYEDLLANATIAFRVATGARHAGELDCRFLGLPGELDPYAVALSNGLTAKTDHPVGNLLSDIQLRCPIDIHGVDFGVGGGFAKTWTFFPPHDLQELSTLADIPSMPRSLAANAGFFARHGLAERVGIIGIDYPSRTVNVYFGDPRGEGFDRNTLLSMHREFGLPEPSAQMLRLGEKAFSVYVTLSWDSPDIKRIAYAVVIPDPAALPVPLDAETENFVRSAPYVNSGNPVVLYPARSADEEYYKIQSYYQWRPPMLNKMTK